MLNFQTANKQTYLSKSHTISILKSKCNLACPQLTIISGCLLKRAG